MVPAPSGISYRLADAGCALRVSGVHDLPEYAVPHELLDSARSLVSSLLSMGDFLLDFLVEGSPVYRTIYDKIYSAMVFST